MARDVSPIEVQTYGISSQPSQSKHPICIIFKKMFRDGDFFLLIVN